MLVEPRSPAACTRTPMKDEPLEGNLHYGTEDREYLDRDPIQPDLLPTQLNLLRWLREPWCFEAGKAAARQTGLAVLASLRDNLGNLDRVKRIVKTLGLVNCAPDFYQQPAVINGFSELMAEVFGPDAGVGARSAVGAPSLPGNIAVEVEAIFELNP